MKHVELDNHFVCNLVAREAIQVKYIHTSNQLVDLLTKPLPSRRFTQQASKVISSLEVLTLLGCITTTIDHAFCNKPKQS